MTGALDNPVGKVLSREELQKIADICVKNNIIILSDEVYDKLYYVPFTRIANLSPEVERLTLTVGSAGKNFYATGWRVGTSQSFKGFIDLIPLGLLTRPCRLASWSRRAHQVCCGGAHTDMLFITFSTAGSCSYRSAELHRPRLTISGHVNRTSGFEEAEKEGFWDACIKDMKHKQELFNSVWNELGLPYSEPEGGYFVMVNMAKVQLPAGYHFPPAFAERPRDFKLAWFLMQELGVAAIPPTEFCQDEHAHLVADWLRFAVCKPDEILEDAKERLKGLKKFIK
jgi:kynurenine aminotransferase